MLASTCFSIIMERAKQEIYEILREYMSEFKRQKNIDSIDFQIDVIIIE